ncbi:MAG: ribosome biogenesis GTPase YlqF [Lachnospiraceae bacterium]|nr:ribosome biogenesis GTPase YlqF [Lachnospiraceae bacterium]
MATYQWFPGHMTRSIRQIEEQLRLIDLIIEIVDARIPYSGRNPELDRLAGGRQRMILFGKTDLADPEATEEWMDYFREKGITPFSCDLRDTGAVKKLTPKIREVCKEKIERDRRRGIMNRPVRAMAAGIPNVGKSTFINSFAGSSTLKTGNKPGVTKGKQWIKISREIELMDTPGLLWPKFEDQEVGLKIALIGSMPDAILNTEELAGELIHVLGARYPEAIEGRYGKDMPSGPADILMEIALRRGCLIKGGAPDTEKASALLLDDFRTGRLGRMTLERPGEVKFS